MAVHVTDLLSDYIDDALKGPELSKVKSHLTFCNACRRALKEIQDNIQQLKKIPAANPPAGLEQRILTKLLDEPSEENAPLPQIPETPISWAWLTNVKMWGVVTTCALVLLIVRSQLTKESSVLMTPPGSAKTTLADERLNKVVAEAPAQEEPTIRKEDLARRNAAPEKPPATESREAGALAIPTGRISDKAQESPKEFLGGSSGITDTFMQVISSHREWKNVWKKHTELTIPPPPVPEIDFNTHEVLALFAGTKSSGGHSISITRIELTDWEGRPARVVFYKIKTPPPGAMTTMALTQPYIMRIVPRFNGHTFFRESP